VTDAPTWYDVLDVPRDASPEEVRSAWKDRIADLEPGDRRFDMLNRAAKVLLDPPARAAYDETIPLVEEGRQARHETEADEQPGLGTGASAPSSTSGRAGVPSWLLAGLGVLAAGLVVATTWTWTGAEAAGADPAVREAQVAAERAVVPVLSYDHETLEADQREAQALMTGSYREEYDKLFTVIEDNAPQTQTKVTASVAASGIVRASDDRVQVLVFVDRPTTNKLDAEPVVYKDQVTVSMQRVDGEWLVDDLVTSPAQG
jgi:Mce-associated membrane protein